MKYLWMLLLLSMGNCKCPKPTASASASQEALQTNLTLLLADRYGGAEEEGLEVIRSRDGLQKFFARINRTRKPGLPVPEVDFEKTLVLAYFPGSTRDTLVPELYAMKSEAGSLDIGVKNKETDQAAGTTAVLTPFALYRMPMTKKDIRLRQQP